MERITTEGKSQTIGREHRNQKKMLLYNISLSKPSNSRDVDTQPNAKQGGNI